MNAPGIITQYWQKPIPVRHFDWCAHIDGHEPNDDGHMVQGFGPTEATAVADLLDQLDEMG